MPRLSPVSDGACTSYPLATLHTSDVTFDSEGYVGLSGGHKHYVVPTYLVDNHILPTFLELSLLSFFRPPLVDEVLPRSSSLLSTEPFFEYLARSSLTVFSSSRNCSSVGWCVFRDANAFTSSSISALSLEVGFLLDHWRRARCSAARGFRIFVATMRVHSHLLRAFTSGPNRLPPRRC